MNILEELKWRGLIFNCTNEEELNKKIESKITVYCGFDPTADCLHLGSLLPIVTLMRFQKAGHNVLPLVGGATGFIGDPRENSTERSLLTEEELVNNVVGIKKVLEKFIKLEGDSKLVNNYDWIKNINVISFLRDYGKYFGVNYMLAKDAVKSRLETGISYTEFSYMIIQAIDFKYLYENYNCILQIGGQDQWGNITAGFELIRKTHGENKAFALTSPLLLKSDGTKFGKSAGGSLWLDKEKTTPYEIYQFLLNVEDNLVISLLKYYTFLTKEEIDELEVAVKVEPHLRKAQKKLAEELIVLIHGKEEYENVKKISEALFSGEIKSLTGNQIKDALKEVSTIELKEDINVVDLLLLINAASSKREAREFLSNNAVSINGDIVNDLDMIINKDKAIDSKYVVIRRGKKNYYLAVFMI